MRITVLTVGRPRAAAIKSLCDEYPRRASPLLRIELDSVSAGDPRGSRDPARAVAAEGVRLVKRLDGAALNVALDQRGRQRSSEELARWLGDLRDGGRAVRFVVGGAFGIAPEALARCPERLSLGKITLPHDLALVVLLEQLYRAKTILAGEPYHHG